MRLVRFNGVRNRSVRRWGPEYASIHYTAGDGTALDNCRYFEYNPQGTRASADYVIDKDGTTVQYNCDLWGHYTWAVGDGHGRYGINNANCVHIEVVSSGEDFTEAQIAALSELVPMLMREFGIPADHVVRHYDASRKLCPKPYIDNAKWRALHARITGGAQQTTTKRRSKMPCIYQPNGEGYLVYYDGSACHPLAHPDEVTAIQMVHRACYGCDIPMFELGTPDAPWAARFEAAVERGA